MLRLLRGLGRERADMRSCHAAPPAGLGWAIRSKCSDLGVAVWCEDPLIGSGRWILRTGLASDVELPVRRCVALRGEETKLEMMSASNNSEVWLATKRMHARTAFVRISVPASDRGSFWQLHWDTVSAYLDWLCTREDIESVKFALGEELRSPLGICPQINSTELFELIQWARDEFPVDFLAKVLLQVGNSAQDILSWRDSATPVRTFVIGMDPSACEAFLALLYALILPRQEESFNQTHSEPITIRKQVSASKSGWCVPAASSLASSSKTAVPELYVRRSSSDLLRRTVQSYGSSLDSSMGASSLSSNSTLASSTVSVANESPKSMRSLLDEQPGTHLNDFPPIAGYHRMPMFGFAGQAGQFSDEDIDSLLREDLRIMGYAGKALVVDLDEQRQSLRRPGDELDISDVEGVDEVQACLENFTAPLELQREVKLCTGLLN